ncbi:MAG: hydrolase [Senegalia sp. (in: firmicutes)]|uniref:hydrolase n=1 Tax=Senegalia sp. (in: firmicutes) TaxID=1924098 RepID=UPI003F947BA7
MDKFTLEREESVLVIIDIQEKLAPVMDYKDMVVKNTQILIAAAKEMNIPIIVTEQYPKGLGTTVEELEKELNEDTKIEKLQFSACTDEFKNHLDKLGRKKIIMVGMETHVCVFQTARNLLEDDYNVYIARDGVTSRTKENYLNGLDLMRDMGAVITNTETIVFDLLKKSATDEFKILSKMVK